MERLLSVHYIQKVFQMNYNQSVLCSCGGSSVCLRMMTAISDHTRYHRNQLFISRFCLCQAGCCCCTDYCLYRVCRQWVAVVSVVVGKVSVDRQTASVP